MSYSYTKTNTRSYTYANVRYVNDKITGDLEYLLALYPSLFTRERLNGWKNDFFSWMNDGNAKAIKVQFQRNNQCFCEIKWEIQENGTITGDDNVGKLRLNNLDGATTYVIIECTDKWYALTDQQKQNYYHNLELSWGPAEKATYTPGLTIKLDKQYSSGLFGVQRSILAG